MDELRASGHARSSSGRPRAPSTVVLMIGASDITGFVVESDGDQPHPRRVMRVPLEGTSHNTTASGINPFIEQVAVTCWSLDDPASRCWPRPGIERRMGKRYSTHVFLNASTGRRKYRPTPASRGPDKVIPSPLPRR
jgi:hypothetical protein